MMFFHSPPVCPVAEIKLVEAEYFIETDPGEGNGTLLDAEDLEHDRQLNS